MAARRQQPRRGRPDRQRIATMATITAAMVKDLRETTGAGMMDCKQALSENAGDLQAAIDWLRKKGLSKAAKKAGRVAAEGLIGALTASTRGVVVEVNSETDFVARNEQFQGLVKMIAQVALKVGADVEKIKAAKVGDVTVETAIADAIATIGENMTLRRAASLEVSKREKAVLEDKYRQQGKPENVIEKIVESGLKTYYKEVCLLEQAFIHDSAKSVGQAVKEAEGKIGAPVEVTGFVRYALGEGIDKQESDFAAEVAATSGKK